jgi:hypothetical protein
MSKIVFSGKVLLFTIYSSRLISSEAYQIDIIEERNSYFLGEPQEKKLLEVKEEIESYFLKYRPGEKEWGEKWGVYQTKLEGFKKDIQNSYRKILVKEGLYPPSFSYKNENVFFSKLIKKTSSFLGEIGKLINYLEEGKKQREKEKELKKSPDKSQKLSIYGMEQLLFSDSLPSGKSSEKENKENESDMKNFDFEIIM